MPPTFPAILLVIEAASSAASVALVRDDVVVAQRDVVMGASRDDALLPAIADVLSEAEITAKQITVIACGEGPGSFTSLRIAAALAKGLAVANGAELYAVPSLLLAAAELRDRAGMYVLHSDALRGERYALLFAVSKAGIISQLKPARRVSLAELETLAQSPDFAFPADATASVVADSNLKAAPEAVHGAPSTTTRVQLIAVGQQTVSTLDVRSVQPHARNVTSLRELWPTFGPVNIAQWEPLYGRLAEAQVKWESTHGRELPVG